MRYKLKNIVIHDEEHISATLWRDDNVFVNPSVLPTYHIFHIFAVKLYKKYAEEKDGILTVDESKLPDDLKYVDGIEQVIVPLGGNYIRVDKDGNPIKDESGMSTIIDKLTVYVKTAWDYEEQKFVYVDHPKLLALSILSRYYKELTF